ncbi:hypothetical protein D9M71_649910 [compost metagenome]
MQVDEGFVEKGRICPVLLEIGADIAVGNLGGLFHHVAQLPGQLEAPVEGVNARGLDRQGGTAHAGPGQARDDAGAGE